MTTPIVFKCEPLMYAFLKDGKKTWDARLWDMQDERCYRLSRSRLVSAQTGQVAPVEERVTFVHRETLERMTFEYLGLELHSWAPGWGFIKLGRKLQLTPEEQLV